jgi:hypothetical protein
MNKKEIDKIIDLAERTNKWIRVWSWASYSEDFFPPEELKKQRSYTDSGSHYSSYTPIGVDEIMEKLQEEKEEINQKILKIREYVLKKETSNG